MDITKNYNRPELKKTYTRGLSLLNFEELQKLDTYLDKTGYLKSQQNVSSNVSPLSSSKYNNNNNSIDDKEKLIQNEEPIPFTTYYNNNLRLLELNEKPIYPLSISSNNNNIINNINNSSSFNSNNVFMPSEQSQNSYNNYHSFHSYSPLINNNKLSNINQLDNKNKVIQDRRSKNRERVRRCRKRKQDRIIYLENRNKELIFENQSLHLYTNNLIETGLENPLNEKDTVHLKELQEKTINNLVHYINNNLDYTSDIWLPNAHLIRPLKGFKLSNSIDIMKHISCMHNLFDSYNIKILNINRPNTNHCTKINITWQIECKIKNNIQMNHNQDTTISFHGLEYFEILTNFIPNETFTFQQTSHITFENDKIAEEIIVIDIFSLLHSILSIPSKKFSNDFTKEFLKSILTRNNIKNKLI